MYLLPRSGLGKAAALGTAMLALSAVLSGCVLDRSITAGADGSIADSSLPPVDADGMDSQVPLADADTDSATGDDSAVPDAALPDTGVDAGPVCIPSGAEVCDTAGVDEDCDGGSNEDCVCTLGATRSCTPSAGAGCTGVESCAGTSWGACVPDLVIETCDGGDEDCDGDIDEGAGCAAASGCTFVVGTGTGAGGSSYLLCATTRSFANARTACQAHGYELATIETAQENTFLKGQLSGGRWWIGLQSNMWVSGSTAMFRDSGSPGAPECAVLDDGAGDWGGDPCGTMRAFICEAPVP